MTAQRLFFSWNINKTKRHPECYGVVKGCANIDREEAINKMRGKVPFFPLDTRNFNCPLCNGPLAECGPTQKCPTCDIHFTVKSVWPEFKTTDPYKQLILC